MEENINLPARYDWVKTDDPQFRGALDAILNSRFNLFINGPAGVGKSVMIELAYNLLKGNTIVLGSTGVSSARLSEKGVPSSTIHRGLSIKAQDIFGVNTYINDKAIATLEKVDTVIIEEVSMVSASLFEHIMRIARRAERRKVKPIRFIMFGDILQLSPVVRMSDINVRNYYNDRYDGNIFFFSTKDYRARGFECINLDTIYRQKDEGFQGLLNRIRVDFIESDDLALLNKQVIPFDRFRKEHEMYLILSPRVETVKLLNEQYGIPKRVTKKARYIADVRGSFDWKEAGTVEPYYEIYEGQQVMCIANDRDMMYQNGTLGVVTHLGLDSVIIRKENGEHCTVRMHTWPQYEYKYDPEKETVEAVEVGTCTQIGCKPSVAVTIHKSQGLTLDSVYLMLEGNWVPDSGIYVALSRCRTLEGIGLNRPIYPADIHILDEPFQFLADRAC